MEEGKGKGRVRVRVRRGTTEYGMTSHGGGLGNMTGILHLKPGWLLV